MNPVIRIAEIFSKHSGKRTAFPEKASQPTYDPEKQIPVMRCSICTGEKVAGFRSVEDGHFTEVMVIHTEEEEKQFCRSYGVTELRKEY